MHCMVLTAQAGNNNNSFPLPTFNVSRDVEKGKGLANCMSARDEANAKAQRVVQGLMAHSNNSLGVLYQTPHSWWCLYPS